jgi:hypothetical protein
LLFLVLDGIDLITRVIGIFIFYGDDKDNDDDEYFSDMTSLFLHFVSDLISFRSMRWSHWNSVVILFFNLDNE